MTTTLTYGMDRVFQIPTAFSAGFMKDPPETSAANFRARHRSLSDIPARAAAMLSPILRIILSFAYVMNQMEQSLLPNEKSLRLVDAIYNQVSCLPWRPLKLSARRAVAPYLADHHHGNLSPVRRAAMFEEENSLPRPELHFAVENRNHFARTRQHHADMRSAVVGAFIIVFVVRIFGHEFFEKSSPDRAAPPGAAFSMMMRLQLV